MAGQAGWKRCATLHNSLYPQGKIKFPLVGFWNWLLWPLLVIIDFP
jgi:hypothetical protein